MKRWAELSGVIALGLSALLSSCSGGNSLASPPTATLTATPSDIATGQNATLSFASTNADQGSLDNGIGVVGINGQHTVSPTQTTTYTFTATGPDGSATATAKVTVSPSPTVTISAKPSSVSSGQSTTLTVIASNASQVVITDNEDSNTYTLAANGGTQPVSPTVTTTYTATATGVNQSTTTNSVVVTVPPVMTTPVTFDGLDSDDVGSTSDDVDPNGAVGTLQFLEYVNTSYQAYDKVTQLPVYPAPVPIGTPWPTALAPECASEIQLDAVVLFDRIASRWVIAAKTTKSNDYNFCIAVSKTDDLSSCAPPLSPENCWNSYEFSLNSVLGTNAEGDVYFPDWPKLGTGPDAYYAAMDLNDPDNGDAEVGVVACAFNRADLLAGAPVSPSQMQCFKVNTPLSSGIYLSHSLIPADIDGTTAPPAARDEFMISIQNPPRDGTSTTSNALNLWDFHLDWTTPANSTFTQSSITVAPYTPGCYTAATPSQTVCVPEPPTTIGQHVDSVGDRLMPRFGYRNFGTYESFLVSHTVQTGSGSGQDAQQTGIRWYELRSNNASQAPTLFNDGTVSPDTSLYRFLPSIAQDHGGNAAVGYSVSNTTTDPGINVSWWNLVDPGAPTEASILTGTEEEVTSGTGDGKWGSYAGITVDPVDDCTFWYSNEYFGLDASNNVIWKTRIANFQFSGCP
jgi:hypothetical protein